MIDTIIFSKSFPEDIAGVPRKVITKDALQKRTLIKRENQVLIIRDYKNAKELTIKSSIASEGPNNRVFNLISRKEK